MNFFYRLIEYRDYHKLTYLIPLLKMIGKYWNDFVWYSYLGIWLSDMKKHDDNCIRVIKKNEKSVCWEVEKLIEITSLSLISVWKKGLR